MIINCILDCINDCILDYIIIKINWYFTLLNSLQYVKIIDCISILDYIKQIYKMLK